MNNQKFTLNSDLRIEVILLSLTPETYKQVIDQLKIDLKAYGDDLVKNLDKYLWLVENQMQGKIPNKETLKKEFPEMIFDDYSPIQSYDELTDYIQLFTTQKQQRFISGKLGQIADTIRSQGLDEKLAEEIYKYTAIGEATTDYSSIVDNYKEIYTNQVEMKGLSFLCPDLDDRTGGIVPGTICTILGATGSMKTTYASNVAFNAIKDGKNVLFLSLEETPMQLFSKWLSRTSADMGKPIPHSDITKKTLEETDEKILLEQVIPYFQELPGNLYIVGEQDLPSYKLTALESKFKEIDKLAQKETGHGIDMLVVDHIQLLKFAQNGLEEHTVINMYMSFFRQQSLSWLHEKREICILILSQANREGVAYAQRHDGQYLSQHLAEASEVERASSYIISVYTDSMTQVTRQLKMGAVKLRNAPLPASTIVVSEDGAFYQVGDIKIPEQADYSMSQITEVPGGDTSMDDMIDEGMLTFD